MHSKEWLAGIVGTRVCDDWKDPWLHCSICMWWSCSPLVVGTKGDWEVGRRKSCLEQQAGGVKHVTEASLSRCHTSQAAVMDLCDLNDEVGRDTSRSIFSHHRWRDMRLAGVFFGAIHEVQRECTWARVTVAWRHFITGK